MKYKSLNNRSNSTSFREALSYGLAPDKGLYFPEYIIQIPNKIIDNLSNLDEIELCYEVIKGYIGDEISKNELLEIISKTISFNIPLKNVHDSIYSLELFHGPTLAFKDIGAKFMALCLNHFNNSFNSKKITVLVATSGDTGGAVANGFKDIKDIDVCILYPKGKVSKVQELQITTNGSSVRAIEVDGDFDLCQSMVKEAFNDKQINSKISLTSANSINIARWLPQIFYYFLSFKNLDYGLYNIFSVPSGNFGNLCAGILSKKMGLKIDHFIASTNINDTVPRYLENGILEPNKTISTISNAMDVSIPSNFIRIQNLYDNDYNELKKIISGYSFDDFSTKLSMKILNDKYSYICDPHSTIGYLGLQKFLEENQIKNFNGIFLSTAHPIKFKKIVEESIGSKIEYPHSILKIFEKKKISQNISTYEELKEILID